jgi:hypothetical protein
LPKIQKRAKIIKGFFNEFPPLCRHPPSDRKERMAKRSGKQVFLGVQWNSGSWDILPPLCELVIKAIGKRSLLWNLPALPADNTRRAQTWLKAAVRERLEQDLVAAMGFAGACHPILTMDELEKELSWAIENPWGTGIAQALEVRPDIIMPRVADVLRADALAAYRNHGFRTLGVQAGRGLAWFAQDGLECFTCQRLSGANPRGLPRGSRNAALIMLDLSAPATAGSVQAALNLVLGSLAPEGVASPLSGGHSLSVGLRSLADLAQDWSPFPAPLLRQALGSAPAGSRKKRKKNEEYRALLFGYSLGDPRHATAVKAANPLPDGSHLVAQMLGEVSLAGAGFDVKLAGGRFTGIAKNGRDVLPARPARSYLRVGGRNLPFRTRNSFSFEWDKGTGLREVLGIDSQEAASLNIEYSFREESAMLEITADVLWPPLAGGSVVEEHAPLVITLRELGRAEEAQIRAEAPDGSAASLCPDVGGWMVIPGSLHRIPLPGGATLVLRPGPTGNRGWSLASFRVAREGRRRFLEANPFGGWFPLPAALISERRERFSLLVGIEA